MNNPFKSAEKVQKKLKVLVYGESGTGKTMFALSFPGKVAVIDTEGGTELYGGRGDVQDFDVIRTKSYEEVMSAIDFIEADGGKTYQTLVVDPITVVYQVLQEAAAKNSKTRDGGIDMRGWGVIKTRMNRLYVRLTNLPVHVVVTSRLKESYEQSGSDLVRAGVKPDSEKSTPYLFDIVLRMEKAGRAYRAVVEKDRSNTLGSMVENVSYANLAPIADAHTQGVVIVDQPEDFFAQQDAVSLGRELNGNNYPEFVDKHWTEAQDWKKFYIYCTKDLGLTHDEVHEALEVESAKDFTGSKKGALDRLTAYAEAKREAAKDAESELDKFFAADEADVWTTDGKKAYWKEVSNNGLNASDLYAAVGVKGVGEFFARCDTPSKAYMWLSEVAENKGA